MTNWDARWLEIARHVASWSKDRSRPTGCVITGEGGTIVAVGYNGFPRGVNDAVEARHQRPAKYLWTEHAERNAIYNAARNGTRTLGCTMYLPWYPCADCARAIVQAGIRRLVAIEPDWQDPKWSDDFAVTAVILQEGNVLVSFAPGEAPVQKDKVEASIP